MPVQILGRHRAPEPVALAQVAVKVEQELRLPDLLYAFGMHLQAHALTQSDNGTHDCHIIIVPGQAGDKTLIDFQLLHGQALEPQQR